MKECGELSVSVTKVQDNRERVVLLRARYQEIQEEALAAACSTEHKRVPHVLNM